MISRQLDEEAIFHIARRIADRQARADYLEQVCGDNTALLTRVRALLEIHEQEQDFLRSAGPEATATLDAEPITEAPGTEIGRYRLMEQIGEGGMGVVFVAEQRQPLRRKVALKVIKPGMDSKAVVARFEAERQALALMDHPNIAHVLDAGSTAAGRPYFVMEYVRGVPITEYCDQNRLTIRERLELFIQVCQAIQHAHQKGVVHRDIKPSNVLVTLHDDKPVPKVIDFGVAKALNTRLTERTIYTAHMQVIGTLMYMSPEQAQMSGLDVDTRADVYGLGVLLYELLTGTTPFQKEELDQAGFDEQRRIIREKEPPRASMRISSLGETATTIAEHRKTDARKLHQQICGDLDWIVMKALEKDRTRRYETASGFAVDVQRFLCDEPIEARPPSTRYRLGKLASRHRTALAAILVVASALLTSAIVSTWQATIAYQERGAALLARRQAEEAQVRAERGEKRASDTAAILNRTLFTLQTELLDRALGDALAGDIVHSDYSLERAQQAGASEDLIRVIRGLAWLYGGRLADATNLLEQAEKNTPNDPTLLAALVLAYVHEGEIQKYTEALDRLTKIESEESRSASDHERLLVAFHKVFMSPDLVQLVEELDDIISRHDRWGLAYAIRAEAKTNLAKRTLSMAELESAREDAELAIRYHPDNVFVLTSAMNALVASIELGRNQHDISNDELKRLEAPATEIAQQLTTRPDYLFGAAMRLVFLRLMNRERELEEGYQDILTHGFGGEQPVVARMLVDTTARELLDEHLKGYPSCFPARTARLFVDVLHGDTSSAQTGLEALQSTFTNLNQRWLMLDVALAGQDPGLARRLANDFYRQESELEFSRSGREDLLMIKFYAGMICEDELLEECGPFLVESTIGHYAIGMWKLSCSTSASEIEEAKRHLAIAADCPVPGLWHVEFAKAYLWLIDDGRLPPTPNPREE